MSEKMERKLSSVTVLLSEATVTTSDLTTETSPTTTELRENQTMTTAGDPLPTREVPKTTTVVSETSKETTRNEVSTTTQAIYPTKEVKTTVEVAKTTRPTATANGTSLNYNEIEANTTDSGHNYTSATATELRTTTTNRPSDVPKTTTTTTSNGISSKTNEVKPNTTMTEVRTTFTSELPKTSSATTMTTTQRPTITNKVQITTRQSEPATITERTIGSNATSMYPGFVENVTTTSMLPTIPPDFVRYPVSSDYYFADLKVNTSSTAAGQRIDQVPTVAGPFGFGNAVQLSASKRNCLRCSDFYEDGDSQCVRNPGNCSSGLSVSIWQNIVFEAIQAPEKSYIFSSGGDTEGMPGIALYHKGVDMHAVVSNGSHYWHLNVAGPVPNNTWSNIGLRWKATTGLEMYVDKERVGMVIYPETTLEKASKKPIEPPEVVVGCHVVSNEPRRYVDFSSGRYDELAIWMHRLNDTEVNRFLGGYDEMGAKMTVDDLKAIITSGLNLSDPEQQQQAVNLLSKMTEVVPDNSEVDADMDDVEPTSGGGVRMEKEWTTATIMINNDTATTAKSPRKRRSVEVSSTQTTPAAASPKTPDPGLESFRKKVEKLRTVSDIVALMTDVNKVKKNMTKEEMFTFQDLLIVISNMFSLDKKQDWETIQKEKAGSSAVVEGLQNWTMALLLQAHPRWNSQRSQSFHSEKFTANIVLNTRKMMVQEFRDGQGLTIPDYRNPEWDSIPWREGSSRVPLDSVALGRELFSDLNRPKHSHIYITSFLFDTYDDIAPRNVNTRNLPSKNIFIDSKVISVAIEPNDGLDYNLYKHPVVVTLAHNKKEWALRSLLFHDESRAIPTVKRRYCATWDSDLHPFGGWDSSGCDLFYSNDDYSICNCDCMGTYAIIAQNIERRTIHPDPAWLLYIKYVIYTSSAFFLVFYILVILFSRQLKDQFHIIRLHTAFATLAGTACMFTTDYVRGERHECTAVTAVLHYAYVAVACCLLAEAHALLSAIIYGVIGGKLKSYLPFTWGCPMIFVGIAFITGFQDYGFEPRCMVSWDDRLKWALFAPNLLFSIVTILVTCATLINVSFAAVKKEIVFEDVSSVAWGLLFIGITFLANWVFACLAYLDIELMYPDYYPIFQVLNASLGTMEFLFMGLGSKRFRIVLRGGTVDSRHFPLVSQKIINLVPVKPQPKHNSKSRGPLEG